MKDKITADFSLICSYTVIRQDYDKNEMNSEFVVKSLDNVWSEFNYKRRSGRRILREALDPLLQDTLR